MIDGNVPRRSASLGLDRCVDFAVENEKADNVEIDLTANSVKRRLGVHVLSFNKRRYVFVRVVATIQIHQFVRHCPPRRQDRVVQIIHFLMIERLERRVVRKQKLHQIHVFKMNGQMHRPSSDNVSFVLRA